MKQSRLLAPALTLIAACTWVALAVACDSHKTKTTTAASKPAVSAVVASSNGASSCGTKTTAVTASKDAALCGSKTKTSAAAAGHAGCYSNTKSAKSAGKVDAVAAGGSSCSGHGALKTADKSAHMDCDACADMSACSDEIEAAGARTQVVTLKNGVMFVYTADNPSRVRAVQAAMSSRGDRMTLMTASDKAQLCGACKAMRGAAKGGKLHREVVNIEGGCLTLMTSNDPSVVAKIHSMCGAQGAAHTKS